MCSLAASWRQCVRTPNDSCAWQNLLDGHKVLFGRIAVRVAHQFGVTRVDEIDDVIQEVCLKMSIQARLGKIPVEEDGALEAYLRALVANAAHDYFRGRRAKRRDVRATSSIEGPLAPQLRDTAGVDPETAVLMTQIQDLVGEDERDRNVFSLYYQQGWTAKEISAIPLIGLTAKGVESLVYRLTAALRERVRVEPSQDRASRKGIQGGGA